MLVELISGRIKLKREFRNYLRFFYNNVNHCSSIILLTDAIYLYFLCYSILQFIYDRKYNIFI